jgi:hypothetical protein
MCLPGDPEAFLCGECEPLHLLLFHDGQHATTDRGEPVFAAIDRTVALIACKKLLIDMESPGERRAAVTVAALSAVHACRSIARELKHDVDEHELNRVTREAVSAFMNGPEAFLSISPGCREFLRAGLVLPLQRAGMPEQVTADELEKDR